MGGPVKKEAACVPQIWLALIANFFAQDLHPVRVITKVCASLQLTLKHNLRIVPVPISLGVSIALFLVRCFQDPFALGEVCAITMGLASAMQDSWALIAQQNVLEARCFLALGMERVFLTVPALVLKDIMELAATHIAPRRMGLFALEEVH